MRALLAVVVLALVGCRASVDPNNPALIFSCKTTADCGDGFECRPQKAGGGFCFKLGACTVESCNLKDDDCNGVIDDDVPLPELACAIDGGSGACATGGLQCVMGAQVCVAKGSAEICNGLDDDCDFVVDDGFNLNTDNSNCGACGRACGAGTSCRGGLCRESNCADGLDNDADAGVDCEDPACLSNSCEPNRNCGRVPDAGIPDAGVGDGGSADAGSDAGADGGVDGGDPDGGQGDGGVDAGFDGGMDAGADAGFDGGMDAGVDAGLDAGTADAGKFGCFATEATCDNALDDDFDGLTDCADTDCAGKACAAGKSCMAVTCQ